MRYASLAAVVLLAACGGTAEATPVSVTAGTNICDVMPDSAPAGPIVFSVRNAGDQPSTFTVTGPGDAPAGELPDLAPGAAKDLVGDFDAGSYTLACGTSRATFTVTD